MIANRVDRPGNDLSPAWSPSGPQRSNSNIGLIELGSHDQYLSPSAGNSSNRPPLPARRPVQNEHRISEGEIKEIVRREKREDNRPFWRSSEEWHNPSSTSQKVVNAAGTAWGYKYTALFIAAGYAFNGANFYQVKSTARQNDQNALNVFCYANNVIAPKIGANIIPNPGACPSFSRKRSLNDQDQLGETFLDKFSKSIGLA